MRISAFLFALLIITPVFAASTINTFSAQGSGSIMRNLETSWSASASLPGVLDWMNTDTTGQSIEGTSGSNLLTSGGDFRYQTRDVIDATENNRYNSSGYYLFADGGIFSEMLSMTDNDVGQGATISHDGILQSAEIQTAKLVSDANISMGQQAEWEGAGLFSRDINYWIDITRESDNTVFTYEGSSNEHSWISTNSTGGAIVRPEFSFIDFSDAYIFKDNSVNSTTNISANETEDNS